MGLIRRFAALIAVVSLTACGTLPRDSFTLDQVRTGQPAGLTAIRASARDTAMVTQVAGEIQAAAGPNGLTMLALSGGGANGAFGAGVLVGWTKSGTRPKFDVVTGVSTGAIAAPFAFLGPEWDDRLAEAYTESTPSNLLDWRQLTPFRTPALFSIEPLRAAVGRYVNDEFLRAIAAEHAKGRRLLVATTNLDTEETIIWDLGAIAARGGPRAKDLFRDVIVASSSIPGAFPPAMIRVDGVTGFHREMHIDGAMISPFLAFPEGLPALKQPADRPGRIYVIINGKIDPEFAVTPGSSIRIVTRAYDSMRKAATKSEIERTRLFGLQNNFTVSLAAIPQGAPSAKMDFSITSMRALFETGLNTWTGGPAFRTL